MSVTSRVSGWRWRHVLHSLDRQWHRRLEADLAAYATPRERTDVTALLDGYPDADTAVLREILWAQQERAQRRRRPVAGFGVTRSGW